MENKKQSGEGASVAHAIKTRAKKYPRLYVALHRIFAPSFGLLGAPSLRSLAEGIFKKNAEAKIANIGSGVERVHPRVVNVDIFPLPGVDIVARAESLPFKDASLDGIFLSEVLEHILDTAEAVREIRRALQSGGLVYIRVPFLYPFHESPGDFYRWTLSGLRYLFTGFEEIKSGAAGGPFALLQAALMHIMGMLFSFGSERLYFFMTHIGMVLFSPLKLFDILLYPFRRFLPDAATDLYILFRKK